MPIATYLATFFALARFQLEVRLSVLLEIVDAEVDLREREPEDRKRRKDDELLFELDRRSPSLIVPNE